MRLPSDPTIRAGESLLLRWVAPFVGLIADGFLIASDSRNALAYGAASALLLGRPLARLRDDPPASTGPPPTPGSPPPADS